MGARGTAWLLGVGAAAVALALAVRPLITFPLALVSGTCIALAVFPPADGLERRHVPRLLGLVLAGALWTCLWHRAWAAG